MSIQTKHYLAAAGHLAAALLGVAVLALGLRDANQTLQAIGASGAALGLMSFGWGHVLLAHAGEGAKQIEAVLPLLDKLPPQYRGLAKVLAGDLEAGLKDIDAAQNAPPPPAPPPAAAGFARLSVLLLLVFGFLIFAGAARAGGLDLEYATGPTVPVLEYRSGYQHPAQAFKGGGYQISISAKQLHVELMNRDWDVLSLDLALYGDITSNPLGASAGALSGGVLLCTMNSVLCVGVGADLSGPNGGLVSGNFVPADNVFPMVTTGFNFALSPEPAPAPDPTKPAMVSAPRRHGATFYLFD